MKHLVVSVGVKYKYYHAVLHSRLYFTASLRCNGIVYNFINVNNLVSKKISRSFV